jgi:hypothetical protein
MSLPVSLPAAKADGITVDKVASDHRRDDDHWWVALTPSLEVELLLRSPPLTKT